MTQPEPAGGLFVLYVAAGGGLEVVGLDPKTGRTIWQANASPGVITPGVPPTLGVIGSIVTFLGPVDNTTGSSQVVGVDAATGRAKWHTGTGMFEDWPAPCADEASSVCTTGSLGPDQRTLALRFRGDTGALTATAVVSPSPGGRALGPDLYDPGSRSPEELLAVSGSSVSWTRALTNVFGPGLSSDNGWDFDRVPAGGLFVGSVEGSPASSSGSSETVDLSRSMTAGFHIGDGATVWRDNGTTYACGQPLPCPGTLVVNSVTYTPPSTGLRLRMTGTATSSQSSPTPVLAPGARIVIEGFDLATGKTLWSYDAGADGSLISQTPPLLTPTSVALPAPGGNLVALNLVTGAQTSIPGGSTAWCHSIITFKTQVAYQGGGGSPDYTRIGGQAVAPCSPSGSAAATPKSVPGFVGAVLNGLTAWSEQGEVAAAPSAE